VTELKTYMVNSVSNRAPSLSMEAATKSFIPTWGF
jgi:hypothetical protein